MSDQQRNVFGEPIEVCSLNPTTGFYRSGCCETGPEDVGVHTVCVEVTKEFLVFSKARGNDLSTPRPEYGFPGLKSRRPLVSVRRALAGSPCGRRRPSRRAGGDPRGNPRNCRPCRLEATRPRFGLASRHGLKQFCGEVRLGAPPRHRHGHVTATSRARASPAAGVMPKQARGSFGTSAPAGWRRRDCAALLPASRPARAPARSPKSIDASGRAPVPGRRDRMRRWRRRRAAGIRHSARRSGTMARWCWTTPWSA